MFFKLRLVNAGLALLPAAKLRIFEQLESLIYFGCTFIAMSRPLPNECDPFYYHYIDLTEAAEAPHLPARYKTPFKIFFSALPPSKASYAYAEGKWTLKQVLQHLLDVERVFVYRLLWIVRGDRQPLPGFDENAFADQAPAHHRTLQSLIEEWLLLRESTDHFIAQLTTQELAMWGTANGSTISAKALCFIIYGHALHHMNIISERYLP